MNSITMRVVALVFSATLAGCAAGVLVGGGKGGESATRYPGAGDAQITREITRRLVTEPGMPAMDVQVETRNGVVTLGGKVPSRALSDRAEELAREVPGVTQLRNNLRIGR